MEPLYSSILEITTKGPGLSVVAHQATRWSTFTDRDFVSCLVAVLLFFRHRLIRIQHYAPLFAPISLRQDKRQGLIVGIEQHVKAVVDDPFAANIRTVNAFPIEKNSESFGKSLAPLFFSHLQSVGRKPADIRDFCAVNGTALKPLAPSEDGVLLAQLNQPVREFQQFLIRRFPVKPRDFIVLTIGVIVTPLGAADLISSEQHRDSLRQKQRG